MKSVVAIFLGLALLDLSLAAPGLYFAHLPAQPADTKVFRDFLGNQQTSYAYQDGHSSAVAVSRSDSNTHLVHPVVYETPVVAAAPVAAVAPVAPAVHAVAPVAPAAPLVADYAYGYEPAYVDAPAQVVYDDPHHHHHHHHHDYSPSYYV